MPPQFEFEAAEPAEPRSRWLRMYRNPASENWRALFYAGGRRPFIELPGGGGGGGEGRRRYESGGWWLVERWVSGGWWPASEKQSPRFDFDAAEPTGLRP